MTRQNIIPLVTKSRKDQLVEGQQQVTKTGSLHALIPLWDLCNHQNGKVRDSISCLHIIDSGVKLTLISLFVPLVLC
jgi:hypothetical protein